MVTAVSKDQQRGQVIRLEHVRGRNEIDRASEGTNNKWREGACQALLSCNKEQSHYFNKVEEEGLGKE